MWADGSFEKESFSGGSWLYGLVTLIASLWRAYIVPKEARGISVGRDV